MWIASSPSHSACSASTRLQALSRSASGLGRQQQQASSAPSSSSSRSLFSASRSASKGSQELQLTLALIKPSVCSYQPDVSAILKEIKQSGLNVSFLRFPSTFTLAQSPNLTDSISLLYSFVSTWPLYRSPEAGASFGHQPTHMPSMQNTRDASTTTV